MDIKEVLESLNSPSDWFVVLGAGTLGLVVDGAINIAPLPFFSPGICGGVAASAALAAKRGWEARELAKRQAAKGRFWLNAARDVVLELKAQGDSKAADDLLLEIGATSAGGEIASLESAVRLARAKLKV